MRALFKTLKLKNNFRTRLKKWPFSSTYQVPKKKTYTDNSSTSKNSKIIGALD